MKTLHQFNEEPKKEKSEPLKEGQGADDKQYVLLMEEYRRVRRRDQDKASEIMEKAKKLKREGDVSPNARLAGCYI